MSVSEQLEFVVETALIVTVQTPPKGSPCSRLKVVLPPEDMLPVTKFGRGGPEQDNEPLNNSAPQGPVTLVTLTL